MFRVETPLLAYTALAVALYASAVFLTLATYLVARRRLPLLMSGAFCGYLVEVVTILAMEWHAQNRSEWFSAFVIDAPALKVAEGMVVLGFLWAALRYVLDRHGLPALIAPLVVCGCVQLGIAFACPSGRLAMWGFYSMRQAFLLGCLAYAALCGLRAADETYRRRLDRYRRGFAVVVAMVVAVLAEDSLVIFLVPEPSETSGWISVFLYSRNVSENVLMAYLAVLCMRDAVRTLALRFDEPPVAAREGSLTRHVADRLPAFVAAVGLSRREAEVMELVAEGMDNRAIAQRLYLSEGTVRTHVHNVMKKAGVNRREDLAKRFWSV